MAIAMAGFRCFSSAKLSPGFQNWMPSVKNAMTALRAWSP
jgi:hypothetical protein